MGTSQEKKWTDTAREQKPVPIHLVSYVMSPVYGLEKSLSDHRGGKNVGDTYQKPNNLMELDKAVSPRDGKGNVLFLIIPAGGGTTSYEFIINAALKTNPNLLIVTPEIDQRRIIPGVAEKYGIKFYPMHEEGNFPVPNEKSLKEFPQFLENALREKQAQVVSPGT